ncbi:uncharacterized protein METZ01_LOCUS69283 [marine metagenome]|uniref:ADP,ATP carrier protein n=1 Tax=marine metagenome TaxID=408172 RepID=A0A381TKT5_9ZZZZ
MLNSNKLNPVDRFLRLFADVRAGEGATALLLSTNVFLLLTSYYIIKALRDGLILGEFGAEARSYTSAAIVGVLAIGVPLYGKLADHVSRNRLINIATMFFVFSFVGFYGLWRTGFNIGVIFYVWVAVFNLMIVAQFWAFANDIYNKAEGERLFPVVAFGQSLGAVVGAMYVETQVGSLTVGALLLVAAGLLAFQVQVTNYIARRELPARDVPTVMLEPKERGNTSTERPWKAPVIDGTGPFKLVLENRYLLMIGLLMLLLNLINSTGGYILGSSFEAAAATATGQTGGDIYTEYLTKISASFFRAVNIAALLIQFFLVSRIVRFLGVGIGLMILPAIAVGGYGLVALFPVLPIIRMVKIAENSTDYSLQNTVRNILFLPTTREQKYKGKQVVDSFFVRVGDAMQAVVVFVGTSVLAASLTSFAAFNAIIAIVWLILAFMIGKKYRQTVATNEPPG